MPLPLPRLDNRTFDQLLEEATALLPRLAPGWTDYNLHDPGITLVEMLAWLVETDMYRLDRTPPAAFRNFLKLVGIFPHPPRAAKAVLVFIVPEGTDQPIKLPTKIQAANFDKSVIFQAKRVLVVSPARLQTVLTGDEGELSDSSAKNGTVQGFAPFGTAPQPGSALYLGFDRPVGVHGNRVSLYFWSGTSEKDAETVRRATNESIAQHEAREEWQSRSSCPGMDWLSHYSARTQWEYFAGGAGTGQWRPLLQVSDGTRALTLSGALRFKVPQTHLPAAGGVPSHPGQFFIRCRFLSGHYECPPHLQQVALNAISMRHSRDSAGVETPNPGSGCAGQTFRLANAPVIADSTRLRVVVNGQAETWQEALSWENVRPHERSYVLSPESGQISFGDGLHGRVPPDGAKISVLKYRIGGGAAGNVRADSLKYHLGAQQVTIEQPFPAFGGQDAETLDQAKSRAMQWLNSPQRAVSLADFETLAKETPGAPVLRAHALADHDPALPYAPALGSVTVLILPKCANPLPEAGPDMLRAVDAYLQPRRTLTTELHVTSPGFVTISVSAQLGPAAGANSAGLIPLAQSSLNTFLDALHGGADGQGWPMGRDVYQSEIMAVLNNVPGVEYVDNVRIQVHSRLEIYQGYISWMQVFERAGSSAILKTHLRVDPGTPAGRVTQRATLALESYFKTRRGASQNLTNRSLCQDVTNVLAALPEVCSVEDLWLDTSGASMDSCGTVTLCAHELTLPGTHQLTLVGSPAKRNAPPDC